MLTLNEIRLGPIAQALALLPPAMSGPLAELQLLSITQQEDRQQRRRQWPTGPARGLFQFEPGTRQSRGGVWGIYLHEASRGPLRALCTARNIEFDPSSVYVHLQTDDVLAAGCARLLLWTDPKPLPKRGEVDRAWALYLRTWRPGKPRADEWAGNYSRAMAVVPV